MHVAGIIPDGYMPFASEAAILLSLSALCAQVWDLIIHFTDEVGYLWRGKFSRIKGLYLTARYGILAAQIANQYLSFLYSKKSEGLLGACLGLSVFRSIVAQAVLTLAEVIAYIRIYALHNKNRRVGYFILAIFIISNTTEAIGTGIVVRSQMSIIVKGCITPRNSRTGMAIFGAGAFLSHSIIFIMTIGNFATRGRSGWQQASKAPHTGLLCREGLFAFCIVLAIVVGSTGYEVIRNGNSSLGHAIYAWYLASISIAASRFILRLGKLGAKKHRHRHAAESTVLTTF